MNFQKAGDSCVYKPYTLRFCVFKCMRKAFRCIDHTVSWVFLSSILFLKPLHSAFPSCHSLSAAVFNSYLLDLPYFMCPFSYQWVIRLFPAFSSCKRRWNEHLSVRVASRTRAPWDELAGLEGLCLKPSKMGVEQHQTGKGALQYCLWEFKERPSKNAHRGYETTSDTLDC